MGKKKNKTSVSWDAIEADLKKYCQKVLSSAAGKVRDDMTEEAYMAIVDFYNDYNPVSYRRHYFNFINNSFEKYYQNSHNKTFRGGVRLTPSDLYDIYQDPTQEVFDTVYAGFHGPAGMFETPNSFTVTPRMQPSPIERLYRMKRYIVAHAGDYIAYGKEQAKRESYSVLKMR